MGVLSLPGRETRRHADWYVPIALVQTCLPMQAQQSVGVIAGPSDDEGVDVTNIDQ